MKTFSCNKFEKFSFEIPNSMFFMHVLYLIDYYQLTKRNSKLATKRHYVKLLGNLGAQIKFFKNISMFTFQGWGLTQDSDFGP